MNLWDETIEKLCEVNQSWDDVIAVCGDEFQITKEDFKKYANTNYDNGYGPQEVAYDLKIVGDNWWLERCEYDGSEWWEFKQIPDYEKMPYKNIFALTTRQAKENGLSTAGYDGLEYLNICEEDME